MTSTTKIILGIVGAAAVGAVVGLLLAPEKGSELRQKVKDYAGDWTSQLSDLFSSGKEEFDNIRNRATQGAEDLANRGADRFNSARENFS